MIPLTVNPKIVVLIKNGAIHATGTNVAVDLQVIVVNTDEDFKQAATGQPFIHSVN